MLLNFNLIDKHSIIEFCIGISSKFPTYETWKCYDIYYCTCNTCLASYFFKKSSLRFKGRNLVIKTEINVRSMTVKALFVYMRLNYFLYWFWFISQYIDIRLFLLVYPLLTYYLRFDTAVTTCRSLRKFSMFYWI